MLLVQQAFFCLLHSCFHDDFAATRVCCFNCLPSCGGGALHGREGGEGCFGGQTEFGEVGSDPACGPEMRSIRSRARVGTVRVAFIFESRVRRFSLAWCEVEAGGQGSFLLWCVRTLAPESGRPGASSAVFQMHWQGSSREPSAADVFARASARPSASLISPIALHCWLVASYSCTLVPAVSYTYLLLQSMDHFRTCFCKVSTGYVYTTATSRRAKHWGHMHDAIVPPGP
jgi:hypothetical protein